jgi:HNH nuclease
LIPACKDCNSNKGNSPVNSKLSAPLHPYFDDVDNVIWLCADVVPKNNILVAQYYVNPEIEEVNVELYSRLCAHLDLYKLKHAYSVQASTEISENIGIWKKVYQLSGKQRLLQYLTECLQSYETAQKNTWKTALLRGIYNAVKDDIINEF